MKISEKELEDFLFKNLNEKRFEYLKSIGFYFNGIENLYFYQQTHLGDYGRSDIIGIDLFLKYSGSKKGFSESVVIEIKEGCIDEKSIIQALRYLGAVESCLHQYNNDCKVVLIGSSVDVDIEKSVSLFPVDISIFTYKLSLDGISFNCNSMYDISDPRIYDKGLAASHGEKLSCIIRDLEDISAGVVQKQ